MTHAIRVLARIAAVMALAWLGWLAWQPPARPSSTVTKITLWTAGAQGTHPTGEGVHRALPEARDAPAQIPRVPDAAFLRRHFPRLRAVEILGDGVEAADADALRGLEITWLPAKRAVTPALTALAAPRVLAVGQGFRVQGRIAGLTSGAAVTIGLEGPKGEVTTTTVTAAAPGDAAFLLAAAGSAAVGNFAWKLRPGPGIEPVVLGMRVEPPALPRLLLLQAAPTVEVARLQRWCAETGARVTLRSVVSAGNIRFTAANGSPEEFAALDAAVLRAFDVVVASDVALSGLGAAERAALRDAIADDRLGLLLIGDPAAVDEHAFWTVGKTTALPAEEADRQVRLRLAQGTSIDVPVGVVASELVVPPAGRWLARDPQGRVVAAVVRHGAGWVGRSLVMDTWRWPQGGHAESFAQFWAHLLSALARPLPKAEGWTVESGSPAFVHEPVRLAWAGANEKPAAARITTMGGTAAIALTGASMTYWPEETGWHEVRDGEGREMASFYVQPESALQGLQAQRRREATARLLLSPRVEGSAYEISPVASEIIALAIFVLGASLLWWDRHRA